MLSSVELYSTFPNPLCAHLVLILASYCFFFLKKIFFREYASRGEEQKEREGSRWGEREREREREREGEKE